MADIEREFKWEAAPRGAFARFERALSNAAERICAPEDIRITDTYLDNARGDFSAQKVALRIRCQRGKFEATLKTRTALVNGLACRRELTQPLPKARSFASALKELEKMTLWENMPLHSLRVRFVLRNRRRIYLVYAGQAECEATLDRYTVYAAEKKWARREIELELKKGPEKDFMALIQKLQEACLLEPVKISKVAGAEELLKGKEL